MQNDEMSNDLDITVDFDCSCHAKFIILFNLKKLCASQSPSSNFIKGALETGRHIVQPKLRGFEMRLKICVEIENGTTKFKIQ